MIYIHRVKKISSGRKCFGRLSAHKVVVLFSMRSKYNLRFISHETFFSHVFNTVKKFRELIDFKEFDKNKIYPIKLSFDAVVYGHPIEQVINLSLDNSVCEELKSKHSDTHAYLYLLGFSK